MGIFFDVIPDEARIGSLFAVRRGGKTEFHIVIGRSGYGENDSEDDRSITSINITAPRKFRRWTWVSRFLVANLKSPFYPAAIDPITMVNAYGIEIYEPHRRTSGVFDSVGKVFSPEGSGDLHVIVETTEDTVFSVKVSLTDDPAIFFTRIYRHEKAELVALAELGAKIDS
jgi:hypothetical protein